MKKLRNEEGVALITALMFVLLTLGMIMALMQMLLVDTQMSATHKTYRNALDAAYAGTDLVTKEFITRLPMSNYSTSYAPMLAAFNSSINLAASDRGPLGTKLGFNTADWSSTALLPAAKRVPLNGFTTNAKDLPDFTFQLQGEKSQNFKVYAKIIDTVAGNSDTTGVDYLDTGAGVAGAGSGIAPKHNPSLYTIEVQGERAANPKEKAQLSVLYAY